MIRVKLHFNAASIYGARASTGGEPGVGNGGWGVGGLGNAPLRAALGAVLIERRRGAYFSMNDPQPDASPPVTLPPPTDPPPSQPEAKTSTAPSDDVRIERAKSR